MADDKSKRDFRDRDRVTADEDYEVEYFATKTGITPQQVKELIAKHGQPTRDFGAGSQGAAETMTRLSDLGRPLIGHRHEGPPASELAHFLPCLFAVNRSICAIFARSLIMPIRSTSRSNWTLRTKSAEIPR
ncbi:MULTISPECIES: DUF3606 domain-containing protein [unclassified Mesorhizobium]|uniref:DUF3606 domain-containing protein n=1 Tax=unclassified Mesorhizobium TaxID=325217 RepID=UPI0003CEEAA0|nr:hypothetical protein X766_33960 [Mesorhizobium sp. LSJC255A00]